MRSTPEWLTGTLVWAAFCAAMLNAGGGLLESYVYIPNWFHDLPGSLEAAFRFLEYRTPGAFFQLVLPIVALLLLAAIALAWRLPRVRNNLLLALVVMVAMESLTFVLVYPQIGILQDVATRPIEEIRAARDAFRFWGVWVRLPMMAIVLAFQIRAVRAWEHRDAHAA